MPASDDRGLSGRFGEALDLQMGNVQGDAVRIQGAAGRLPVGPDSLRAWGEIMNPMLRLQDPD